MSSAKHALIRAGFGALHGTGLYKMMQPRYQGVGALYVLHHVRPPSADGFQPNLHLEITPEFLRTVLAHVRSEGVDIVTLPEARRRMDAGDFSRRFACFGFDDGYRDTRDFALPVMREFGAPFTTYVTSNFAEGTGELWWVALERLVREETTIEAEIGDTPVLLPATTAGEKTAAFHRLSSLLRSLPTEAYMREELNLLCGLYGFDSTAISRELCLGPEELRLLAQDPLVTVGAHTVTHSNLARLDEAGVWYEITAGRDKVQDFIQMPVTDLAYPYGGRDTAGPREFAIAASAGLRTAVTTRPGMLFPENAAMPTGLPRISLNGHYQDERSLAVLSSGAATAMWNGFRRTGS